MVRNKSNTSVKVADEDTKIIGSRLPTVNHLSYLYTGVRVANQDYISSIYAEDIINLKEELKFKQSCQEVEIQPFITEAI
jgi:hypothetical protein